MPRRDRPERRRQSALLNLIVGLLSRRRFNLLDDKESTAAASRARSGSGAHSRSRSRSPLSVYENALVAASYARLYGGLTSQWTMEVLQRTGLAQGRQARRRLAVDRPQAA